MDQCVCNYSCVLVVCAARRKKKSARDELSVSCQFFHHRMCASVRSLWNSYWIENKFCCLHFSFYFYFHQLNCFQVQCYQSDIVWNSRKLHLINFIIESIVFCSNWIWWESNKKLRPWSHSKWHNLSTWILLQSVRAREKKKNCLIERIHCRLFNIQHIERLENIRMSNWSSYV